MNRNVHMTPERFEQIFQEAILPPTTAEEFELAWHNLNSSVYAPIECKKIVYKTMMQLMERIYNDLAKPDPYKTLQYLAEAKLKLKAKEYSVKGNRLHNFNQNVWCQQDKLPTQTLNGYNDKQLMSVHDILTKKISHTPAMLEEKLGDVYNYCILLYAIAVSKEEAQSNEPVNE